MPFSMELNTHLVQGQRSWCRSSLGSWQNCGPPAAPAHWADRPLNCSVHELTCPDLPSTERTPTPLVPISRKSCLEVAVSPIEPTAKTPAWPISGCSLVRPRASKATQRSLSHRNCEIVSVHVINLPDWGQFGTQQELINTPALWPLGRLLTPTLVLFSSYRFLQRACRQPCSVSIQAQLFLSTQGSGYIL